MKKFKYKGSCHCQNISLELEIRSLLNSYLPRACDCSFCTKHNAAYLSDNSGSIIITVRNRQDLQQYQHGDKLAKFLFCKTCGILIGVGYRDRELYFAVNSNTLDEHHSLGARTIVSPKMLGKQEKIARWKNAWFDRVTIEGFSL